MLSLAEARVIERHAFEEFDIAGESDPHVGTFNQVMAEQRGRRKAIAQNPLKGPDVVDGFAVKDALAGEVLVDIAHRMAIRIGAMGVGKDARKPGGGSVGQRDADARLNDAVAATAMTAIGG